MTEKSMINWSKEGAVPRSYGFQFSPKLFGKWRRKGFWSPDGSAEVGSRKLRFRSNGKANMHLTIFDRVSEKELGHLDFHWKDFQRSKLELSSGSIYYFRSFDLIRGAWSWIKEDAPNEQFVFRIDSPLQRSGTIENQAKDLSAEERDILLLLGLNLTQYFNTWLMTIILVILGLLTGR
ncbi:MAG: hypothetical protein U9Q77_07410 [Candidatus Marinimicrobia bacterium]|nr:hypothetical protein [Candidatus Neomarinimicrobiota bacterium]